MMRPPGTTSRTSSGAVAAVVSSIVPVPERDDQLHDGFFSRSHSRAIAEVCEQFYFRRRGEHFEEDVLQFSDDVFSSLRLKTIYY